MIRREKLRAASVLVLTFAVVGFVACDAHTRVQGTIVDSDGNPIPGATVSLTLVATGRAAKMSTQQDGRFSVELIHGPFSGRFGLIVSKSGYEDYRQEIPSKTSQMLRVALTKTETQGSVSMVTPQSIVQQMFPNAQKKAENVDCFRSLTHETSINMAVEKCGRPDEEVGSGLYIFVYHLRDGSTVAIGTPYLDRIFDITYTKPSGKSVPLLTAQQPTERVPKIICTPPSMKVLKMVRPTFPPDAKAKNIFGKVAVEAEIDKEGRPTSVRVLKGDPVLAAAVVEAVKKWRWKPLRLNGDAVEAVTTIVVNFEPR